MVPVSGIIHIVLITWRPAPRATAGADAEALVDRHLPGIPGVLQVDRGVSVSPEGLEGGFDWALVVRFEDEAALRAYLPHPEHQVVGAFLREHADRLVVFDLPAR